MSKKTLNAANLAALGADQLAALLIEVSTGSADIKRRLRLELSHNLGAAELVHDVRKRLTSIRRSKSFVGWRKRKALIKDLTTQADMITQKIAPDAPAEAFDLLWQFIAMSPSVYDRVDDSKGDVSDVFQAARLHFAQIGPRADIDPQSLAERIWDALRDNAYGEFDGIIGLLAPTLGDVGLENLKKRVTAYGTAPLPQSEDHAALQFLQNLRSSDGNYAANQRKRLVKHCLQQIAEAQGDTHGYVAQYSPKDLQIPRIAAEVAQFLLADGAPQKALDIILGANLETQRAGDIQWDEAYLACLLALGRVEDAQDHRWGCFCETLDTQMLRDYLKVLPDFEDLEQEDAAKAHALQYDDVTAALQFFIAWPDFLLAAQLLQTRAAELDGNRTPTLTQAGEALRDRFPLAAVIAWRAMIDVVLWDGHSARYAHAAEHLADCAALDGQITDYKSFLPHDKYLAGLREAYPHKSSFWARVPEV